eukprot:SAG31_NODE_1392_length_8533_cov_3.382974_5_plen_143_part_00
MRCGHRTPRFPTVPPVRHMPSKRTACNGCTRQVRLQVTTHTSAFPAWLSADNYSVAQSPLLHSRDLVHDYVASMRKGKIGTGIYFQLYYDYWGGFLHGKMQPNGDGAPKLTAEQFFDVATQQLEEIWDPQRYGNHTELWCFS